MGPESQCPRELIFEALIELAESWQAIADECTIESEQAPLDERIMLRARSQAFSEAATGLILISNTVRRRLGTGELNVDASVLADAILNATIMDK